MSDNEIRATRLILKGDKELAATHAGDAKYVLAQLNNIQQTGPGGKAIQTITKQFLDGTVIKARTDVNGLNIIEITSGNKSDKKYSEWEFTEEIRTESIVPILELCKLSKIDAGAGVDIPDGFAAYNVSKIDEEKGEFSSLIAYTTKIGDTPDTGTTRAGFCKINSTSNVSDDYSKIITETSVEEIKRYDSSWYSFKDLEWSETGPLESYWDYVDWQDCDNAIQEPTYTPGRRPDDSPLAALPEWVPCEGTGGYGDFAYIVDGNYPQYCGINTGISIWWPPNFKQTHIQEIPETVMSWMSDSASYDYTPSSEFSGVYYQQRNSYINKTYYGIVWSLSLSDDENVSDDNVGNANALIYHEGGYGFGAWYWSEGNYIIDNRDIFLYLGMICGDGYLYERRGYDKGRRNARDPEIHFGVGAELTDEQLSVLEGNHLPDVGVSECEKYLGTNPERPSYYHTGEYFKSNYESGHYYYVNVCKKEYKLRDAYYLNLIRYGYYSDRQQVEYIVACPSYTVDIGIFSDSSKDATEIDPDGFVHVYSMHIPDPTPSDLGANDYASSIILVGWIGMVYKDVNYFIDAIENYYQDDSMKVAYTPNENMEDNEGNKLYFSGNIRAGKKVEIVKKYKREVLQ